jgi:hypothetical protein
MVETGDRTVIWEAKMPLDFVEIDIEESTYIPGHDAVVQTPFGNKTVHIEDTHTDPVRKRLRISGETLKQLLAAVRDVAAEAGQ